MPRASGSPHRASCHEESADGDGHTITLNGATFAKGLGVHAPPVTLDAGSNSIKVFNDTAFAPDLDRITITAP